MESSKSPCIECKMRHVNCHSGCEGYLSWKKQYEEERDSMKKERKKYLELSSFHKDMIRRTLSRRG